MLHDPKSTVFDKYGVNALPTNVVVDRSGKIVQIIEGTDMKSIEAAVTRALGGK